MNFYLDTAEVFVPDGLSAAAALARTTHLAIAAHQDDIEIMAAAPILDCFQHPDRWFSGVVVTDGRGAPRDDRYRNYSDDEMRRVRFKEQKKAAVIGEYAAQVLLDYPSQAVKDGDDLTPAADLLEILRIARAEHVYTHNLADKHDTHVAVALRVIAAARSLPAADRPQKLYGCEVWRDLDWLLDDEKIAFDLTARENLQAALVGVFDSQIAGGKRYDLASLGRRRANATYFEAHGVDRSQALSFAMDLTPLIADPGLDIVEFTLAAVQRFAEDVGGRLRRAGA
ncbi:MAG: PIG-L deacetylase family protein [Chloroflexota bacterium]